MTSVYVHMQGLTYEIINNTQRKQKIKILDGVSGFMQPKQMLALMGPSGSGTSILINPRAR